MAWRSLRSLPCSTRRSMRCESMSDTFSAAVSEMRRRARLVRQQRHLLALHPTVGPVHLNSAGAARFTTALAPMLRESALVPR